MESEVSNLTNKEKKQHVDGHIAIQFSQEVLDLIDENPKQTTLESLLEVCLRHNVTDEDVASLITPKLYAVLQEDAENLRLLKDSKKIVRLF